VVVMMVLMMMMLMVAEPRGHEEGGVKERSPCQQWCVQSPAGRNASMVLNCFFEASCQQQQQHQSPAAASNEVAAEPAAGHSSLVGASPGAASA
jgi:hypothetical protein